MIFSKIWIKLQNINSFSYRNYTKIIKHGKMKRIGCLSDTHGYLNDKLFGFFSSCDEIWHAGDIGSVDVAHKLEAFRPLKAVYGNIDGPDIRGRFPLHMRFEVEGTDVWITHIGGFPGRYDPGVKPLIYEKPPKLFICGHSHILRVMNDKKLKLLHINPGAAGRSGIHNVSTAVRFVLDNGDIKDLEVLEMEKHS